MLHTLPNIAHWWMWLGFIIFIGLMLSLDFFVFAGNKAHKVSSKEALSWTILWIVLALIFNLLLWIYLVKTQTPEIAHQKALMFFTGYLIEKFLSVDNIFVFLMIFNYFAIPDKYQRRVLLYGVMGAIIMRLIMILIGVKLIATLNWLLYLLGGFLVFTGFKMLHQHTTPDLAQNKILKWLRNHLRLTKVLHGERFFVRQNKQLYATPLLLTLIFIEISDLVFAIDSIPAIFAITTDPFIIFTSNIFAILGLRALYFLLADFASRFTYLQYALGVILMFIGIKMIVGHWYPIPIAFTLLFVTLTLTCGVIISIRKR